MTRTTLIRRKSQVTCGDAYQQAPSVVRHGSLYAITLLIIVASILIKGRRHGATR
jgi:hypothetical protein